MKICSKCLVKQSLKNFEVHRSVCKDCRLIMRKKRGRPVHPKLNKGVKLCSICKNHKKRMEFHRSKHQLDGCSSRCKACVNLKMSLFYQDNKEQIKQKRNIYYQKTQANPKIKETYLIKQQKYRHKKMKEDPFYKVSRRLRNRLYYALKNQNWKKNTHFSEYIGCDPKELLSFIEVQFKNGMSWDNYGLWHIDHKIPLGSAKSKEDLYKLCHYTNLQPLWALENIQKGSK